MNVDWTVSLDTLLQTAVLLVSAFAVVWRLGAMNLKLEILWRTIIGDDHHDSMTVRIGKLEQRVCFLDRERRVP